jgi:Right handed beta helix region
LVNSLDAGQTGCLRTGAYGGDALYMRKPDTALQSYPGERATLTAFLEVTPEAPRSRVSGLTIDTSGNWNTVGTKLQADDAVLSDNVITKSGEGICVLAGTYNPAQRVIIERNLIYDCGAAVKADGSSNKLDHLIYLSGTRDAVVRWNILRANGGGWGVHMYPNADGTLVEHNIIDGNQGGVVFAGDGSGNTADENVVRNNAITGSGPRWNVESSWSDGPAGTGNVATENCLYSAESSRSGGVPSGSFSATGNLVLDSYPYVDRAAGDYRFMPDSPCSELVGDVVAAVTGPDDPPTEPSPPPDPTPPPSEEPAPPSEPTPPPVEESPPPTQPAPPPTEEPAPQPTPPPTEAMPSPPETTPSITPSSATEAMLSFTPFPVVAASEFRDQASKPARHKRGNRRKRVKKIATSRSRVWLTLTGGRAQR